MPKLIKDGVIVEDAWTAADGEQRIPTLQEWLAMESGANSAVQIEPGEGIDALLGNLGDLELIAINFPAFMDGRGFSYGRELRERGYKGELRAVGAFIRDQLTYLQRVGFNAFAFEDDDSLEDALLSLADFSEYYQASVNQPEPLFRRR